MAKPQIRNRFVLRGYIEQVGEHDFFAICLTLNLCTRGASMRDAEESLREAIALYIEDAVEEGALAQWVPRRAPLWHYLRYAVLWLRTHMNMFLPPYDALLISRVVHA